MAKMVKDVYCLVDGKTKLVKVGEDAPKADAPKADEAKLVEKGYAVKVEPKTTAKK